MAKITFYVKPGKTGDFNDNNGLAEQGYEIDIRELSAEIWTPALLRPYFDNRPVSEWFDPQAPQVLSGAIDTKTIHAQGALVAMTVDPGLIRTPLIKLAGRCAADLSAAEWPAFLAGKSSPAQAGAMSEFWMEND